MHESACFAPFGPATRHWFTANFAAPTEVQRRGWTAIAGGGHVLLVAPTGSGKTLAAFLAGIDAVSHLPRSSPAGVRVLYVSPLKALVYDVERNLRAPLAGIERAAETLGAALRPVRIDVRTGDTPARDRRRQARTPGDILVTTPESLFLLLGSTARDTLRSVGTVIIDEVHALAPGKRGVHLALSLERLADLAAQDPQRIGLSATVRPADEVARYLGGDREVTVIETREPPRLELSVSVPVPDMERVPVPAAPPRGGPVLAPLCTHESGSRQTERGLWPALYPRLLALIRENRSTLVFVNSRGLCERLARRLNELAGEELVRAHHGSLSHNRRSEIEEALKGGELRGIVATSSLELGIDMGAIDCVVLVESPGSVARGLQRVGRAGHRLEAVSVGRIFPKFRGDLLECAVLAGRMQRGEIESIHVPCNALDVLAQQVVAMCCDQPRKTDWIARIVRRAWSYRQLGYPLLESVLDMLSGHYPSAEFADLRPQLVWDRAADLLSARRGAAVVARMNAGTIPDRGLYTVHLGEGGPRIGELDEEMVYETRAGDHILLGASTWRVEEITRDRVLVSPAPGEPGRLPFWRGEGPGRPLELGRALGQFVRTVTAVPDDRARAWLRKNTPLDDYATQNLLAYLREQRAHTEVVPTDRDIVVERFRDEMGDWRVCILSPFGARIHAPWAMALQRMLTARSGFEVQVMYTDDGIVLRFADGEELPGLAALVPEPEAVEELVTEQLGDTALFAGLFRENAARALLLPRRRPDRRNPLWAQRLKAQALLATVRRYPRFPVVLETYRQALQDVFDVRGLRRVLEQIRSREIHVHEVETASASPFARSLVFAYVAAYIYEQDAPLAERRAQALALDRNLLAELLGEDELRQLIDPGALSALEAALQHTADDYRARDADELHDLLRRLGDLNADELALRAMADPGEWLQRLARERRAALLTLGGEARWIAAQDAALYRDALGAVPPAGLPERCLAKVDDALRHLVRRYARTHGPFAVQSLARRYGLRESQLEPLLRLLEREGALVHGELRPDGSVREWCDGDVLRRLKRRTLAQLRREVAPVEAHVLARFLAAWHGLEGRRGGRERLLQVVTQLEGLALPWSALGQAVLPARMEGFSLEMLERATADGSVVWIGCGALGPGDGRIALYRRGSVPLLLEGTDGLACSGPLHAAILDHLRRNGASFLTEMEDSVTRACPQASGAEFRAAVWDLVWAGRITNDTLAPLRSLGTSPGRRGGGGHALAGGRWSRVETLLSDEVSAEARAVARARMLLERYGIVSREAVQGEALGGGFAPLYRVLKAMEEGGKARRGYFVEGLSGAQFAHAGALERLRAERDPPFSQDDAAMQAMMLAAIDPANPYGVLLPWPESGGGPTQRPRRVAGAWVVLVRGRPLIYAGGNGRRLLTFTHPVEEDGDALRAAFRALHRLPRTGRRRYLLVERIDGVPAHQSPHAATLQASGFEADYRGLAAAPRI
jgi:ATP-dependent Lhr-like helicase